MRIAKIGALIAAMLLAITLTACDSTDTTGPGTGGSPAGALESPAI
jgi:hypothetical protein